MPKSRFNAVRERARATRHNPVGGRKKDGNENGPQEVTLPTTPTQEDVLPILKSLPLDGTTTINPSEVLWALTSLTGFLSDKSSRVQVLLPQHKLIPRVLLQLNSQNDYQIRDAASGCLRNLCIEAGGKACKALEDQGCVEKCIEEIKVTAKKLALGEEVPQSAEEKVKASGKKEESVQLLKKPRDSLNRKERRQLAKIEEAAAKRNGDNGVDSEMVDGMISNKDLEHLDVVDKDVDDEQYLLYCSHLTNLIAIVWCLAEVSPKTVEFCRRSAYTLSRIFALTILEGTKSIESLHLSLHTGNTEISSRVNVGQQDKRKKDKATVQLAQTALNAMVTLTDSDPEFSAAVVGISKDKLRHSLKMSKKAFVFEDDDAESAMQRGGEKNVEALFRTVLFLRCLYCREDTARGIIGLENQAASLALLSMATIRNIQSCLPNVLRDSLQFDDMEIEFSEDAMLFSPWAPREGEKTKNTLGELEMDHSVDCLRHILWIAYCIDLEDRESILDILQSQKAIRRGQDDLSEVQKEAEDALSNVLLALEILAELVGDREGWCGESGKSKQREDMILVDDQEDEEDEEMIEGEDGSEDDQSNSSLDLLDEDAAEDSNTHFISSRYTELFEDMKIDPLLFLSVQNQNGFAHLREEDGGSITDDVAASLRSISIRALSALNNQFLALASFAQSPPSQPQKESNVIKSFHTWLEARERKHGNQTGQIWRWLFEYASLVAALPYLSQSEDESSVAQDARKVMELCLCIMWSLSRCYEGLDGKKSTKVLAITPSEFAKDEFCTRVQKSLGVIPSLIAAYKTSKKISNTSASALEPSTTLQLAPTPDGIRTHSLGVLSTLVRQSFVSMQDKEKIITLLADVLDVLPTATDLTSRLKSLEMRDSTSMDAMVVAVNGIIDTFANEESQWDHLYSQLRLQPRLKRASLDVKSATRTIDKRKQPALRAAADEAWSNLIDFLQYRDSLVK